MTTMWATEAGLYVGIDNRGNIVTSVSSHRTLAKFNLNRNEQTSVIRCVALSRTKKCIQRRKVNSEEFGNEDFSPLEKCIKCFPSTLRWKNLKTQL